MVILNRLYRRFSIKQRPNSISKRSAWRMGKPSRKEDNEKSCRELSEAKKAGDRILVHNAIQRLENHWKAIAKRDDVRSVLLKPADTNLHNDNLINDADKRWGKGSSDFVGLAIQRYYESQYNKTELPSGRKKKSAVGQT